MNVNRIFSLSLGAWAYEVLTSQEVWRRQIASLLHQADACQGGQALDLGCGPGESSFALASLFADTAVVGIDLSPQMIERARRRQRRCHPDLEHLRFEVADAARLPFADASFDLAIGHSFLYLVPDRSGVLDEAFRVLRPGGCLLLMEPNADGSLARAARAGLRAKAGWAIRRPVLGSRFVLSMVLWRVFSGASGRLASATVSGLLANAGFADVTVRPSLGGLGLECLGSVPPTRHQPISGP